MGKTITEEICQSCGASVPPGVTPHVLGDAIICADCLTRYRIGRGLSTSAPVDRSVTPDKPAMPAAPLPPYRGQIMGPVAIVLWSIIQVVSILSLIFGVFLMFMEKKEAGGAMEFGAAGLIICLLWDISAKLDFIARK
jgi:hypothetical protein